MTTFKRTIPEVQSSMLDLAEDLELGVVSPEVAAIELRDYVRELYRRTPKSRAKPTARRVTPELRKQIRAYKKLHPDFSNRKIGRHFDVDGGRVSEALRGYRSKKAK